MYMLGRCWPLSKVYDFTLRSIPDGSILGYEGDKGFLTVGSHEGKNAAALFLPHSSSRLLGYCNEFSSQLWEKKGGKALDVVKLRCSPTSLSVPRILRIE